MPTPPDLGLETPGLHAATRRRVAFDPFEFDLDSQDLYAAGQRVPLQPLPSRLLQLLVTRAGQTVLYADLQRELWASQDHGEFQLRLRTAVKLLRRALGDTATFPRYIETVPRRGYRFCAPLEAPRALAVERRLHDPGTLELRTRPGSPEDANALTQLCQLIGTEIATHGDRERPTMTAVAASRAIAPYAEDQWRLELSTERRHLYASLATSRDDRVVWVGTWTWPETFGALEGLLTDEDSSEVGGVSLRGTPPALRELASSVSYLALQQLAVLRPTSAPLRLVETLS